jgi:glycosyltransferase involved in cell wall biosynthesis
LAAGGIPLSALRADLDGGWPPGARWIGGGGADEALLEQPVGTRVSFALSGARRTQLRGRIAIAPGGAGMARFRARVSRLDPGGMETVLWQGTLRRVGRRALPAALSLDADLDAVDGAALVLTATGPVGEGVRWSGLELVLDANREVEPAAAPEPAGDDGEWQRDGAGPLFSVLTPVHDPPLGILTQTIDSVRAQSFEDWELCLVDDGSTDPGVEAELRRQAAADARIRFVRRDVAGGIAAATNAALELATGEYVALLDHDDLLLPDALAHVADVLRRHPGTDMVYSDEELFEDETGVATHTFAKPHWSPDLLRSQMYTCHLGVYRHSLAEEIGGFRSEFDGSQDFDFALRLTERTERVIHIPRVLYRWRIHAGSTAGGGQAKPAAYPAARRAIAQHLERTGVEADVHFGPWQGIYRVVHRLQAGTTVAVAIVSPKDDESVRVLVRAVEDEAASGVAAARTVVAPTAAAAVGACADADVVVLCERPVEPLTRLWLARLAGFARQPGVAAVGARTLAPDGRVEQSGFAIDSGLPLPLMYGAGAGEPGPLGIGILPANVAAVAGTVAFDGEALRRLGGLEAGAGENAVPDYCLRGLTAGLRIVSAPDVLLRRLGPPSPVNDLAGLERFRHRWARAFPRDPYFDPSAGRPGVEPLPTGDG